MHLSLGEVLNLNYGRVEWKFLSRFANLSKIFSCLILICKRKYAKIKFTLHSSLFQIIKVFMFAGPQFQIICKWSTACANNIEDIPSLYQILNTCMRCIETMKFLANVRVELFHWNHNLVPTITFGQKVGYRIGFVSWHY